MRLDLVGWAVVTYGGQEEYTVEHECGARLPGDAPIAELLEHVC